MSLEATAFNKDAHYEYLAKWWTQYGWPVFPKEGLPTSGVVVLNDNVPVAAGFLFFTDEVPMCWLEFVVADKDADKEIKDKGLDLLMSTLIKVAEVKGVKTIFTSLNHPGLIERYKKHKFNVMESNMTNLVRTV